MATLLFLGASISQLPAIRHARLAGHRVVAFDGDPHAVAFPLCDVSFAAVQALGLRNGIAFPQLIADRDGAVRIVEVAARIASGQMADLVRLGTGIDLFEIATAQALGRPVADSLVTARSTRPIVIRFLTARPGVLPVGTVTAIDRLRASSGVLAADLYFDVGSTIRPLQVDADRSGYVIATADTPARALALADHAARELVVQTKPGTAEPAPRRFDPATIDEHLPTP